MESIINGLSQQRKLSAIVSASLWTPKPVSLKLLYFFLDIPFFRCGSRAVSLMITLYSLGALYFTSDF